MIHKDLSDLLAISKHSKLAINQEFNNDFS